MKKMIKPMLAFSLIIMGVTVLVKINKIWALNPEQNLNETSVLKSKKNLNVEYFINNIDSDTTYEDLEREIGPFTGSIGSGIVRDYYKAEDLFFLDNWLIGSSAKGPGIFEVEDMSGKYKGLVMYIEKYFKSTEYIKKLFAEKKIISDANKIEIKPRQFFDLNDEYTYEDIENLYGKPHGITDNNRIYYHINSYYVFFPADFSSNPKSKLNYMDVYSENGKFKCRIQYAPRFLNNSSNLFLD